MRTRSIGGAVVGAIVVVGAATALTQRSREMGSGPIDWGHARYSSLTQINVGNVQGLKPVWVYDTGVKGRGWEGSPIVVDGVMYLSIPGGASALDPETGKELWRFVPQGLSRPGRDRGVAYWPGDGTLGARIIYATADRLYALDAKTGSPISSFGKDGMVNLRDEVADKYPDALYTISSPAAIYKNLAIISPSTQEFGSKGPSGDPRAFDVRTGKQVWRFHTVPQPGEPLDGSWGPEGWKERAGPSAWGGATVDPATGLVFIPIGNPDDSYNGIDRPGNNYYANSIIALDANTGKLKWFYQMTHHDITDLDAAAAPSLIDIHRNGQVIPALVEVPKSGIAFILDRRTGKPVFGDEERPIPQSDVPGEHSSPTQPFPLKPEPLARMRISRDDITTLTPEAHDYCTASWDKQQMHNDGPYTPVSTKGTTVFAPGTSGGGNWGGVSTDPHLGYFFVNVSNMPTTSRMVPDGAGGYKLQGAYGRFNDMKGWPCVRPPWGELIAVNANTGDIAWRSPLGVSDDFGAAGKTTGTPNLGGSIATAGGLVFIGATVDSRFRAFDSHTGKEVWTATLPAPAVSTPLTFQGKSGRQYVVVPDGGPGTIGMPGRFLSYHAILIAYALPKAGENAIDLAQYAPVAAPRPPGMGNQIAAAGSASPGMAGEPILPAGEGREDVLSMCGKCHGLSTVVANRRSPDGWRDLIQDMRSRGAQGDDAKAGRVRDYLSRYFGLLPAPAEPSPPGR
ncbi:outer membrane protein assembly factor BamB family protein [Terriglobus albidus]|uniref:outer membrane protein assembly factor BamB family protein n=1 Tax=Terriglobus albidus TaxID=1592106 RepID=UPI0021E04AD7|nr:PQQ-binding-like beta-propeller repeat protein [Terriglobus albidus]